MKGWRPLVALVIHCGWVAELLAEGEIGAHAAIARIVNPAAGFDAITTGLAVIAQGTDVDDLVCIGIVSGLVEGRKLSAATYTRENIPLGLTWHLI